MLIVMDWPATGAIVDKLTPRITGGSCPLGSGVGVGVAGTGVGVGATVAVGVGIGVAVGTGLGVGLGTASPVENLKVYEGMALPM